VARAAAEDHDSAAAQPLAPAYGDDEGAPPQRPALEVYLWPDNVRTWRLWLAVQTQWRVGMSGVTGLDYAGVRAYLDEEEVVGDERRESFVGIRAAESATLAAWAERRKREDQQRAYEDRQHGRGPG
jgi:hypothetical protein